MPRWRRLSIAVKVPLIGGVLLLVVLAGMTVGAYQEVRRSVVSGVGERLDHVTAELADLIGQQTARLIAGVADVAGDPAVRAYLRGEGDAAGVAAVLEAHLAQASSARALEVWAASGDRLLVVGSDMPPLGAELTSRLMGALEPEADGTVGPLRLVDDSLTYSVLAPASEDGRTLGYVVERRRSASSPELLRRLIGANAVLRIGNRDGETWTDLSHVVPGPSAPPLADSGLVPYGNADGEAVFGLARPVLGTEWLVLVELPVAPVMAPARRFLSRALVASLLLALSGAAVGWMLSRSMTTPLQRVTWASEALAAGQEVPPVHVDREDEIGRLARSFNMMATQITVGRHELEQRVADRTAALEAANRELEAFSYSVSHDMRAPLRAIDGFAGILVTDHKQELSPDAARYLEVIVRNAKQMGQLIDDLLAFSRLARQPVARFRVDMTALATEVADAVRRAEPDRPMRIDIQPIPPAEGERTLLQQVLANLIQNAAKFTRPRDPARIEVGHTVEDGHVVYHVKDNGVGFDMRYADKLFGVFQRLHRAEDFEGTGVGLAIVQRIVHRHGGRVWVEAEPDRGATFHFTLAEDGRTNDSA